MVKAAVAGKKKADKFVNKDILLKYHYLFHQTHLKRCSNLRDTAHKS